ncbi:MAG TPA: hypothetical protein VH857_00345 [Actinomycetes bacterium]|jgi:hypothetical protein|nr:hypothetical protein [Actinomycetes bacterium]
MSIRTRTAGALFATMVAGGMTIAATGPATAHASGIHPTSAAVGSAQRSSGPALDAVLELTRSVGGKTYRAAGTYSAGNALTSLGGR